jgi:hypothetical protein
MTLSLFVLSFLHTHVAVFSCRELLILIYSFHSPFFNIRGVAQDLQLVIGDKLSRAFVSQAVRRQEIHCILTLQGIYRNSIYG